MAGPSKTRTEALAAVRDAQRRAGAKVSRLRSRGVDTSGIDPRVKGDLSSLTTGQLQAAARRMNAFTSRSTTFVAGLNGTPLSGSTWRAYQRAEARYNANSSRFMGAVRDLRIPTINQTVGEYLGNLASKPGDYKTFNQVSRNAANITSEKNLRTLLRQMERRAGSDYIGSEADLQRKILNKMLRRTSNADLIPVMRELSDEEIITLQYTEFIPALEGSYAMSKSISSDTPRWQSSLYENNEDTIETILDWARNHFGRTTEQDTSGTPDTRGPARDEYGRFVKSGTANPEPRFTRDALGRFAPRS